MGIIEDVKNAWMGSTQGRWDYDFKSGDYSEGSIYRGEELVAIVAGRNYGQWRLAADAGDAEFESNARLIALMHAAMPLLVEAIEVLQKYDGSRAIDQWDSDLFPSREWEQKRADVIVKLTKTLPSDESFMIDTDHEASPVVTGELTSTDVMTVRDQFATHCKYDITIHNRDMIKELIGRELTDANVDPIQFIKDACDIDAALRYMTADAMMQAREKRCL